MRILIAGGAGCLGTNIIEYLKTKNYEIQIIDNFATGNRDFFSEWPEIKIIEGSISNAELVQDVFKSFQPTHVIHCAASFNDPHDWLTDINTNLIGTVNLITCALATKTKRFINLQTAVIYGNANENSIPIDSHTNPTTSYGISKYASEKYLVQSSLNFVSVRLANVCGPRLAIGPIPTFYKRLKSGQACFCTDAYRDFMDMSDFLELMEIVIDEKSPSGIFNGSSGIGHSIYDVYCKVAEHLKTGVLDVPIVPVSEDDIRFLVLDPTATKKELGWEAKKRFNETMNNQLIWYDQNGIEDIYSHLKSVK